MYNPLCSILYLLERLVWCKVKGLLQVVPHAQLWPNLLERAEPTCKEVEASLVMVHQLGTCWVARQIQLEDLLFNLEAPHLTPHLLLKTQRGEDKPQVDSQP